MGIRALWPAVAVAACSLAIDVDERPPLLVGVDGEAGLNDAARRVPDASDASDASRPVPDASDAAPITGDGPPPHLFPDARPPPPDAAGCVDRDRDEYGDGCPRGPDCDDEDPNIHPGAEERCNELDDDCDGGIDEWLPLGEACAVGVGVCEATGHYVCEPPDLACDATPGESSAEICDGADNDCNGRVDDGARCTAGGACQDGACWAFERCQADPIRVVTSGHLIPLNTRGAPDRYAGSCGGAGAPEQVAVFELDHPATVHFLTFNANFNAVLYVRLVCDNAGTELGCDDDVVPGNPNPLVVLDLAAGQYLVFLDGLDGQSGDADFIISVFD